MSTITVNSFTIPNYRRAGSAAYLRIYAQDTFFTSGGVQILGRGASDKDFYKEITCSVSGNVVTVPTFTIDSTTDSIDRPDGARYTAVLFDSKRERVIQIFENYQVPTSFGSDIDYDELKVHNSAISGSQIDRHLVYTREQVDYLLNQLTLAGATNPANIEQTSEYRFVTDDEKDEWNSKQDSLLLGSDAVGDLYYRDSPTSIARLPIGPETYVITSVGGLPVWALAPGAPDTTPPSVPTGLSAETGGAEGEVDIDWNESTDSQSGVDGYVLRIRVPE